ncbi:vegetative cell wall protein gp1-like [Portunus trituberculatus]|uniref:vegetative cell wall protein gp1-like n=1 Tax=Portunus trituberculatus TaxID=210409 RepID=UPI001E1CC851|nr:vegetative cell wall protein gp1-like [Portunus trituberculatus]
MVRHKLSSLLPQPVRLQLAAAPQALSLEEFSALVDRVHEAHVVSPPADPAPACLCPVNAAAPTDQPTAPAESLSLHVLQQQAAVTSGLAVTHPGCSAQLHRDPPCFGGGLPAAPESSARPLSYPDGRCGLLLPQAFRGGGTQLPTAMCLAPPGKRGGRGPLTPLPASASLPRLSPDPLPHCPISALSPPAVQPAPGPTEPAPPTPLAPQCSMGGHDAPASSGRPTVAHTSSPPAKQRSRDGRAPSPPPSRLQPTGGRASAPPTHL